MRRYGHVYMHTHRHTHLILLQVWLGIILSTTKSETSLTGRSSIAEYLFISWTLFLATIITQDSRKATILFSQLLWEWKAISSSCIPYSLPSLMIWEDVAHTCLAWCLPRVSDQVVFTHTLVSPFSFWCSHMPGCNMARMFPWSTGGHTHSRAVRIKIVRLALSNCDGTGVEFVTFCLQGKYSMPLSFPLGLKDVSCNLKYNKVRSFIILSR